MQGCVEGPERSNGDAHDAPSLVGGAYDIEPAERRSGPRPETGLTLSQEEGQMDRCRHVTGTSLGQRRRADSRAAGRERPPDGGAGGGGDRPIPAICGRADVMSPPQSKLRAVLAGLAVVVVVGLATPSVLGAVTVALWSHSGVFDVSGPARLALFLLDAVAWVAWLRIIVGLCLDVASGLRHPNDPQRSGGLRGHLAGWVLGFALIVLPGSAMGAGLAAARPLPRRYRHLACEPMRRRHQLLRARRFRPCRPLLLPKSGSSVDSVSANTVSTNTVATYTVVSGDCLSTIALRFYGDEGAWTEIWAANANRMMADGMRFVDPNLIYAGWNLILPGLAATSPDGIQSNRSDAHAAIVDASASVQAGSGAPRRLAASGRSRGWGWAGGSAAVGAGPLQGASAPTTNSGLGTAPTRAGWCRRAGRGWGTSRREQRRLRHECPSAVTPLSGAVVRWVPESASLGISALVAAAYLRRIRRRRAQARAARGDDEAVADPDPAAVRLEARLAPFADAPVLEWLELANRHLTWALRAEARADPPRTRVVRVGPAGVEVLLDEPVDWAPGSFALGDDGKSWRLRRRRRSHAALARRRPGAGLAAPLVARRRRRQRDLSAAPRTRRRGVIGRSRRRIDAGVLGRDGQVLALGRASRRGPRRRDGRSTGAAVRWSEHPR